MEVMEVVEVAKRKMARRAVRPRVSRRDFLEAGVRVVRKIATGTAIHAAWVSEKMMAITPSVKTRIQNVFLNVEMLYLTRQPTTKFGTAGSPNLSWVADILWSLVTGSNACTWVSFLAPSPNLGEVPEGWRGILEKRGKFKTNGTVAMIGARKRPRALGYAKTLVTRRAVSQGSGMPKPVSFWKMA